MRRTAELFDNFVQRTTMQMAGGDKDLDNLTGHRAHDGLALDLRANARGRCDSDARRPREQDFIAHLQHGGGVSKSGDTPSCSSPAAWAGAA